MTETRAADPLWAWLRAVHFWQDPDVATGMAAEYRARGWTDEATLLVGGLTRWAVEHGTAVATWNTTRESGPYTAAELWPRVAELWDRLVGVEDGRGLPDEEARNWLLMAVGAPDPAFRLMRRLILDNSETGTVLFAAWRPFGALGPLACAAGLNTVEARERHAVGTLDAAGLRVLAGLRGWQFPDVGDLVGEAPQ